jgi:hypothetical protein
VTRMRGLWRNARHFPVVAGSGLTSPGLSGGEFVSLSWCCGARLAEKGLSWRGDMLVMGERRGVFDIFKRSMGIMCSRSSS